ncbi:MAG: hypothetical protein ACXAD7_16935 [Candidatus Kariarchaeaceae archaeon]
METIKATEGYIKSKAKEKEKRKRELRANIKKFPGETAYSLHRKLNLPLKSIQNLVNELAEDLEIKFIENTEDGRLKKMIYATTIYDFTWDYYIYNNFLNPKLRARELKMATLAQERGVKIQIEMDDESVITLFPSDSILEFLKSNE